MPCRWLLKRIRRYSFIQWEHYKTVTEGEDELSPRHATYALPPLLPSLLAACAPSTKLSLTVDDEEGKSAQAKFSIMLDITSSL